MIYYYLLSNKNLNLGLQNIFVFLKNGHFCFLVPPQYYKNLPKTENNLAIVLKK